MRSRLRPCSLLCACALACSKPAPPGETTPSTRAPAAEAPVGVGAPVGGAPGGAPAASLRDGEASLQPQTEVTWTYVDTPVGPMNAVVVIPARAPDERFPVLVTFHGMGEARKGPARGARGWIDDYGLLKAIRRLQRPPLTLEDLEGFADSARLARLNAALAKEPYRGLVIVNSYTPDVLRGDEPFSKIPPLAEFVTGVLLPRAVRETPALGTARATGVDGVSLGGRAALAIALRHPEAFAAVGGLQPAFDVANAEDVAQRALSARRRNPELSFRLLTSDRDYFLASTRAISAAMLRAGVPHQLLVLPGPHDYSFNRGPAVYEMLIHHDRVLRGLPPI